MELIRDVGAFAGLAAFLGLAVLALLYFAQARDVRRLRENAEFLVEGEPSGEAPGPAPSAREEPPEAAARAAAASAPSDAEAFRRAELARQAAERRQRFEQRRRPGSRGDGLEGERRMPEIPSTAVIVVGALILLAGVGFGATRLLGDDDEPGAGGGGKGNLACPPGQTKVAVLNGTAEEGLAGASASQLKQSGYDVGPVTNTESAFDASTIMFDEGGQPCAPEVAAVVGVAGAPQPIDNEVRGVAEGAAVAVILGEDRASGGSSATDTSSGTLGD